MDDDIKLFLVVYLSPIMIVAGLVASFMLPNGVQVFTLGIIIIFFFIATVLLMGRGGWFIAGLNTMTKEERSRYDVKTICRVIGVLFLNIAIISLIILLFDLSRMIHILCVVWMIIVTLGTVLYISLNERRFMIDA